MSMHIFRDSDDIFKRYNHNGLTLIVEIGKSTQLYQTEKGNYLLMSCAITSMNKGEVRRYLLSRWYDLREDARTSVLKFFPDLITSLTEV